MAEQKTFIPPSSLIDDDVRLGLKIGQVLSGGVVFGIAYWLGYPFIGAILAAFAVTRLTSPYLAQFFYGSRVFATVLALVYAALIAGGIWYLIGLYEPGSVIKWIGYFGGLPVAMPMKNPFSEREKPFHGVSALGYVGTLVGLHY